MRLGAGLIGLLAVLIAGVGVSQVLVVRHVLYARSASGLRTELALLAAGEPSGPSPATPASAPSACQRAALTQGGSVGLPPPPPRKPKGRTLGPSGAHNLALVLAQRGVASAVVAADGAMLACADAAPTSAAGSFAVPPVAAQALGHQGSSGGYVTIHAQGHHLLAIAQPLGADTAIAVTDLAADDAAVGAVVAAIAVGGIVALALAALASRPLLRSALAPLTKVAATADAIAAGGLDQRADLPASHDEVGRLGVAFDRMVDRLHASLAEREHLVGRLRASEEAMRRFLADASHELRTPLTAIRGGAQVLRLGAATDPADLAETLGHLEAQAERMSKLVSDLLVLSRQDSHMASPATRLLDMGGLLASQRRHLDAVAARHPLRLETASAWLHGDPDALMRLLDNLVDNAAKYSPPGSPIEVAVAARDGRVDLAVSDHGPGIPVTERERVFHRFYRGDPARSRATGGSGLGLAIVAGIASEHGATVRIDQAVGGGARIVVSFPSVAAPGSSPAVST
jgi:two-component system OmpR family sensor kinase